MMQLTPGLKTEQAGVVIFLYGPWMFWESNIEKPDKSSGNG
jgi:hypothetical protein